MKTTAVMFGLACVGLLSLVPDAAQAQATRTWVSGVGDDANPCSRTAPCKTFAGAIPKTAAGGEINCLDSGGFGSVTITKSITIKCEGVIGGVLAAGTFGININDSGSGTPGTAIVTISGLDIEGFGTGTNGIQFISGGVLHVHKTQIRNFRQSGAGGNGISVTNSSAAVEVYVANSFITDNGSTGATGGVIVKPTGSGSVLLTINETQIENNSAGVRADSSTTSGTVKGAVRASNVSGSTNNGITAVSGASAVSQLMVDKTSVIGNGFGLVVNGAVATINTTDSSVAANGTGLFVNGSGTLNTYHTNAVNNNTSDGAFTNFISPQ